MWKIFLEYSDKSKTTIAGKTKEITDKQIEKYYTGYAITAVKAVYQEYPKKDHKPLDFKALYAALHMEPCPVCGHKAVLIEDAGCSFKEEKVRWFHVCCNRSPKGIDDLCELIAGYGEEGKIKWFNTEMEAIDYWNEQCRKVKENDKHIQNDRLQAQKTEVG